MAGVLVGAAVPWYHRPLKWLKTGEKLQGRDEAEKLSFTAEKLFVNCAWVNDSCTGVVSCYTHDATEWIPLTTGLLIKSAVSLGGLPTYGYASGSALSQSRFSKSMREFDTKRHAGATPDLVDWHHRRLQQPVTKNEVSVYLSSADVSKARAENRTASQSLNEFLHQQSPTTFPPH